MKIAIIGTGNLGLSIAKGLIKNDLYERQEEDELDYEDQYTVLNEF